MTGMMARADLIGPRFLRMRGARRRRCGTPRLCCFAIGRFTPDRRRRREEHSIVPGLQSSKRNRKCLPAAIAM